MAHRCSRTESTPVQNLAEHCGVLERLEVTRTRPPRYFPETRTTLLPKSSSNSLSDNRQPRDARTDSHYSLRRAVVGSKRAARSAGSQDAIAAITRNNAATATNVTGSVGFTSTS